MNIGLKSLQIVETYDTLYLYIPHPRGWGGVFGENRDLRGKNKDLRFLEIFREKCELIEI